jgi:alginate O-acetyltransferase complex protein AlgJ
MDVEVYPGQDGWLFLAGALAALYGRDAPLLPDAKLHDWVRLIESRAERFTKLGIQYVHMPAPEKLTIYGDKLDPPIVDWQLSPSLRLGELLQGSPRADVWLDIVPDLRRERDRAELYGKTDSHWNAEGAFVAYRSVCERIGLLPETDLLSRTYVDYNAVFDLGAKLDPPRGEWFRLYDFTKNSRRRYANSIAQYLETLTGAPAIFGASHVAFENKAARGPKKKILIFGDSFCAQGMSSLTGMLAETASEVEFVWSSDLDWRYIERSRPDVVLYEMAERVMSYLPKDDLSLRLLFWKRGWKAKWHQFRSCGRPNPHSVAAG